MSTSATTLQINSVVKKKALRRARELGVSLNSLINKFLEHIASDKMTIYNAEKEIPTQYFLDAIRESQEDIKAGRVSPSFDKVEDAVRWLNKKDKKYENKIQQKIRKTI